jgi:hypothetical protein
MLVVVLIMCRLLLVHPVISCTAHRQELLLLVVSLKDAYAEKTVEQEGEHSSTLQKGGERRGVERLPLTGRMRVPYTVQPSSEIRWATVIDASAVGLGLLATDPIDAEAVIGLQLDSGKNSQRVVLGSVRHCTACPDGFWLIGCALRESLTHEEILAFVSIEDTALSFTL